MCCPEAWGPTLAWVDRLARARLLEQLSPYDITPVQTHVLLYLNRCGGQATQQELTDSLRVKSPTANGIIDRMVEKELVIRTVSGRDARRRLITLTERGRMQQELFQQKFQEVEERISRGFSPEEQAQLRAFLKRIICNLKEESDSC